MLDISWLHLFILALASFRLTHLVVFDSITWFLRKPFVSVNVITDSNGRTSHHMTIKGTGWRFWIGSLLTCHWCVGIWSSITLVVFYYYLPYVFPLILILAVAGLAAIIEFLIVKK